MKILLFQTSRTQRVTATKNENGSWLLSKEWRHNDNEPWVQGKGFLVPKKHVKAVGSLLESEGAEDVLLNNRFERIEVEGDGKGDYNSNSAKKTNNYQKTNNWHKTYANYRATHPLGRSVR